MRLLKMKQIFIDFLFRCSCVSSQVWYKDPEFQLTDSPEDILETKLSMHDKLLKFREVCPAPMFKIEK